MATKTLGTNATTTLTALQFGTGSLVPADVASIAQNIKDDKTNSHFVIGESFSTNGSLFIPNRGRLLLYPGDWVGVDSRGWPILLSADTIANGPWTHT